MHLLEPKIINSSVNAVRRHFALLASRGRWRFLCRVWLEAVVLAYAVGCVAQTFFPAGPRGDLANLTISSLLGLVLVAGPLSETLMFQLLPLEFASALKVRRSIRVALSVILFALMHSFAGFPTVAAAGFVGGSYFAFTYEQWRKESMLVAVMMTFFLHASFNAVGVVGMLILPK